MGKLINTIICILFLSVSHYKGSRYELLATLGPQLSTGTVINNQKNILNLLEKNSTYYHGQFNYNITGNEIIYDNLQGQFSCVNNEVNSINMDLSYLNCPGGDFKIASPYEGIPLNKIAESITLYFNDEVIICNLRRQLWNSPLDYYYCNHKGLEFFFPAYFDDNYYGEIAYLFNTTLLPDSLFPILVNMENNSEEGNSTSSLGDPYFYGNIPLQLTSPNGTSHNGFQWNYGIAPVIDSQGKTIAYGQGNKDSHTNDQYVYNNFFESVSSWGINGKIQYREQRSKNRMYPMENQQLSHNFPYNALLHYGIIDFTLNFQWINTRKNNVPITYQVNDTMSFSEFVSLRPWGTTELFILHSVPEKNNDLNVLFNKSRKTITISNREVPYNVSSQGEIEQYDFNWEQSQYGITYNSTNHEYKLYGEYNDNGVLNNYYLDVDLFDTSGFSMYKNNGTIFDPYTNMYIFLRKNKNITDDKFYYSFNYNVFQWEEVYPSSLSTKPQGEITLSDSYYTCDVGGQTYWGMSLHDLSVEFTAQISINGFLFNINSKVKVANNHLITHARVMELESNPLNEALCDIHNVSNYKVEQKITFKPKIDEEDTYLGYVILVNDPTTLSFNMHQNFPNGYSSLFIMSNGRLCIFYPTNRIIGSENNVIPGNSYKMCTFNKEDIQNMNMFPRKSRIQMNEFYQTYQARMMNYTSFITTQNNNMEIQFPSLDKSTLVVFNKTGVSSQSGIFGVHCYNPWKLDSKGMISQMLMDSHLLCFSTTNTVYGHVNVTTVIQPQTISFTENVERLIENEPNTLSTKEKIMIYTLIIVVSLFLVCTIGLCLKYIIKKIKCSKRKYSSKKKENNSSKIDNSMEQSMRGKLQTMQVIEETVRGEDIELEKKMPQEVKNNQDDDFID